MLSKIFYCFLLTVLFMGCGGSENDTPKNAEQVADQDIDGIIDTNDNCVTTQNSNQLDLNQNGIGAACEVLPTVQNISVSVTENTQVTFTLLGADGGSQDVLTYTVNGTMLASGQNQYTYTPPLNFSGQKILNYTVSDGEHNSDNGTITIDVQPDAEKFSYNFTGDLNEAFNIESGGGAVFEQKNGQFELHSASSNGASAHALLIAKDFTPRNDQSWRFSVDATVPARYSTDYNADYSVDNDSYLNIGLFIQAGSGDNQHRIVTSLGLNNDTFARHLGGEYSYNDNNGTDTDYDSFPESPTNLETVTITMEFNHKTRVIKTYGNNSLIYSANLDETRLPDIWKMSDSDTFALGAFGVGGYVSLYEDSPLVLDNFKAEIFADVPDSFRPVAKSLSYDFTGDLDTTFNIESAEGAVFEQKNGQFELHSSGANSESAHAILTANEFTPRHDQSWSISVDATVPNRYQSDFNPDYGSSDINDAWLDAGLMIRSGDGEHIINASLGINNDDLSRYLGGEYSHRSDGNGDGDTWLNRPASASEMVTLTMEYNHLTRELKAYGDGALIYRVNLDAPWLPDSWRMSDSNSFGLEIFAVGGYVSLYQDSPLILDNFKAEIFAD